MDTAQQHYQVGDTANGYIWTGQEWAPVPAAGAPGSPTPWYRKPGAFAIYGVLGAVAIFGVADAVGGETPVSADAVSIEEPAAAGAPEAEVQVAPEPVAEPAAEPAAPVSEQDSLAYQNAVSGAQGDVLDLREDLADLERDLSSGSIGWAAWNFAEIAFNVGQLEAADAPPSITVQWDGLMAQLLAADGQLSAGFETDSISQMQSGIASMKQVLDQMEALLGSW